MIIHPNTGITLISSLFTSKLSASTRGFLFKVYPESDHLHTFNTAIASSLVSLLPFLVHFWLISTVCFVLVSVYPSPTLWLDLALWFLLWLQDTLSDNHQGTLKETRFLTYRSWKLHSTPSVITIRELWKTQGFFLTGLGSYIAHLGPHGNVVGRGRTKGSGVLLLLGSRVGT